MCTIFFSNNGLGDVVNILFEKFKMLMPNNTGTGYIMANLRQRDKLMRAFSAFSFLLLVFRLTH